MELFNIFLITLAFIGTILVIGKYDYERKEGKQNH